MRFKEESLYILDHKKPQTRKARKEDVAKFLQDFKNSGFNFAKVTDWENEYSSARQLYLTLRLYATQSKLSPVSVVMCEGQVYLLRNGVYAT